MSLHSVSMAMLGPASDADFIIGLTVVKRGVGDTGLLTAGSHMIYVGYDLYIACHMINDSYI